MPYYTNTTTRVLPAHWEQALRFGNTDGLTRHEADAITRIFDLIAEDECVEGVECAYAIRDGGRIAEHDARDVGYHESVRCYEYVFALGYDEEALAA